jgi:hypothetical protein
MIKEAKILKGYLKNSCKSKDNDKVNVLFHIHAAEYRKRIKCVLRKRVNVVHTSLANPS